MVFRDFLALIYLMVFLYYFSITCDFPQNLKLLLTSFHYFGRSIPIHKKLSSKLILTLIFFYNIFCCRANSFNFRSIALFKCNAPEIFSQLYSAIIYLKIPNLFVFLIIFSIPPDTLTNINAILFNVPTFVVEFIL